MSAENMKDQFIEDAVPREGYQEAKRFSENALSEHLTDPHHKELPNDFVTYILENIGALYDLYSGGAPVNPGILLQPQEIMEDLVVPAGYNGLTCTDALGEGHEVEIADGSKLYHIDEQELAALVNVVKVSTSVSLKSYTGNYVASILDLSYTLKNTGAASTLTVPDDATADWTGGTAVYGQTLTITNRGSGDITLVAGGSTTFSTTDLKIPAGVAVTLMYQGLNDWLVIGATTA